MTIGRLLAQAVALALVLVLAGCGGGGGGGGSDPGAPVTFSKSYGGAGHDLARSAIGTSDGGYVFVGSVDGSRSLAGDLWISKLDADGNVQWQSAIGGRGPVSDDPRRRQFEAVREAPDGGYVAVGRSDWYAVSPAEPRDGTGDDLWIAKLSASGLIEWQRDVDSGAWGDGYEFWPSGRGRFADDAARDVAPAPDGGYVVTAVSRASLVPRGGGNVYAYAGSVLVLKVDARGQLLWLRRLPFALEAACLSTIRLYVRATADNGAVLAYPSVCGNSHTRVVRLDSAGGLRWQFDDDRFSTPTDLALTADDAAVVAALAPEGESIVLRIDRDGRRQWRRVLGGGASEIALWAVQEVCPAGSPGCEVVVGGDVRSTADRDAAPTGYAARLDAQGGFTLLERRFAAGEAQQLLALRALGDGSAIAAVDGAGRQARRLVLDATSLVALVSSLPFDCGVSAGGAIYEPLYCFSTIAFASDTTLVVASPVEQQVEVLVSPSPLSATLTQERKIEFGETGIWRSDPEDVAVAVLEVAPGSFVVAGETSSFPNPLSGRSVVRGWVLRVTDGRIDWQRGVGDRVRAMARAGDGVVVAAEGEGGLSRLIKLAADGELVWQTSILGAHQGAGVQTQEVQPVGTGFVVVMVSDPPFSPWGAGFSVVHRIDADGRLLWTRLYDGVRAESIAPLAAGGFVVSVRAPGPGRPDYLPDYLQAMRLTDDGTVVWSRRYRVRGAFFRKHVEGLPRRVRATADGGFVIGATDIGVITPEAVGQPFGQSNVFLLKADADGNAIWTRSYGAALDERLHDLQVLPDGGLLVAGGSDSLGEGAEAWLLRLGADGLLAAGCNAHLGSLPVAALTVESADVVASDFDEPPSDAAPWAVIATDAQPRRPDTATARQCSGRANTGATGPAQFALTVLEPGTLTGVVLSTPGGLVCGTAAKPAPCTAGFDAGSDVFLAVDPGSVSRFLRWEDCDEVLASAQGASRCRVRMTGDRTVRAVFGAPTDRFLLRVSVIGTGTVHSGDPGGISCGVFYGANQDCEQFYDRLIAGTNLPTSVSLSVFTHLAQFQGWGGDCAAQGSAAAFNLVMDGDKRCTATFAAPPNTATLTVTKTGAGSGLVLSDPAGISCGATCSASFGIGQTVRLLAEQEAGSSFDVWSGCDRLTPSPTGSSAICEVDLTGDRGVGANFTPSVGQQVLLEIVVSGQDGIVESADRGISCTASGPDCQQLYAPGTAVALRADLLRAAGRFAGWGGDCQGFGQLLDITVLMNGPKRCTATFSSPS